MRTSLPLSKVFKNPTTLYIIIKYLAKTTVDTQLERIQFSNIIDKHRAEVA